MPKGCKIFLTCLLAFAVLVGAFCIVWPLTHDTPAGTGDPSGTPQESETTTQPSSAAETTTQTQTQTQTQPALSEEEQKGQSLLDSMTTEEKVWQLFVVTPEAVTGVETATRAGDATRKGLEARPVGGLIYFAKNLQNREQAMEMIRDSQSYVKIPMLIGVDEEGGTVSRVGSNPGMGTTAFEDMRSYGAAGDPAAVYQIGSTIGSELLELGFNLDFAPVADVVTNPDNTEIGSRSFSSDPETAAKMVGSIVSGFQDAGMICTLKHFPGHGGTSTDTHKGLAVTTRTLEQMREAEFLPFEAGIAAGAPMVMVGHLSAEKLNGDDTPSDLSGVVVTDLLRGELGFDGVVITDAQNMGAITDYASPGAAAVGALQAGVDLILMPEYLQSAFEGVMDALDSGKLTQARIDESVLRILKLKYQYGILN